VIGVPDTQYAEQVVAWVRLDGNSTTTAEDIHKFCEGKIAAFKIPKYTKICPASAGNGESVRR
jgi:fatty-acyl-CoA synthase